MHQAVRAEWPHTVIKGCNFHLGQAVQRWIATNDRQQDYHQDAEFRLCIRSLLALAYIPPGDVPMAFSRIEDVAPERALLVLDYFKRTYIGVTRPNGEPVHARFPVATWNHWDSLEEGSPRTNNSLEGYHHSFASLLDNPHPNIFALVDRIKAEQEATTAFILQLRAGAPNRRKRRKYVELDTRLRRLRDRYEDEDTLRYLHSASYYVALRSDEPASARD